MQELVVIGVIAVLLFGKRLPEVARSLGTSYNEFKKGLGEMHRQVDVVNDSIHSTVSQAGTTDYDDYEDREEATAPKFEPPPAEPSDPPSA